MNDWLAHNLHGIHWVLLYSIIAVCLAILGKSADLVVSKSVQLSQKSGMPKIVIGATIISLGTTLPEAIVSWLAAHRGIPDLALGNAVGSILCDTGLILGLACLISPLPLTAGIVNRQGWAQLASGLLLVMACLPYGDLTGMLSRGGYLHRTTGFVFLLLLILYLWISLRWARDAKTAGGLREFEDMADESGMAGMLKLCSGLVMLVCASWILIPCVEEAAHQLHIPDGIIAATLVAFGTSLPELVTAMSAARRGHGEIVVGNVVGADILNVLFVAGSAAAGSQNGLDVKPHYFAVLFPAMLLLLITFRISITFSGKKMKRPFAWILFILYLLTLPMLIRYGILHG